MQDKRQTFVLFFPEPMEPLDLGNLEVSGVRRVQLFLGVAYDPRQLAQLQWLAAKGIAVTLRIEEPSRWNAAEVAASYYREAGRTEIKRRTLDIKMRVPGLVLDEEIAGNESEIEYDLRRGSSNWGDKPEENFPQGRVWEHRLAVAELRTMLASVGVKVIAPGWSHKRLTPRDPAQPGRMTWARILADVYNQGPAGMHAYCINYSDPPHAPEDENRLLWHVGNEMERIHSEAHLNEINVKSSVYNDRPVERMRQVLHMYELLARRDDAGAIKRFCPFVSNGRPGEDWSNMIMRERACYELLGRWIALS